MQRCNGCGANARAFTAIRTFAGTAIRRNPLRLKSRPYRREDEYRTENLEEHDRSDWG